MGLAEDLQRLLILDGNMNASFYAKLLYEKK